MEWLAILTPLFSFLLAVTGYFIKRHIESVEDDVKRLRQEVSAVKQDAIWLTKNTSELKTLSSQHRKEVQDLITKQSGKIIDIRQDIASFQSSLKDHEKHLENYGKVIMALSKIVKK